MIQGKRNCLVWVMLVVVATLTSLWTSLSSASPVYSRQYEISCLACHDAFPKLNDFGESFAANNFRLPQWRETMVDTGDDRLALPSYLPLALRTQAYLQWRDGEQVDVATGTTSGSGVDFQTPYTVDLLSSAPLSENLSYYLSASFARRGDNGETTVEDAWFRYGNLSTQAVAARFGQFEIADLMFARDQRLTFQDYYAYRAGGITFDRGLLIQGEVEQLEWAVGAVNGSGHTDSADLNGPGVQRHDRIFDNDTGKTVFARLGGELGEVSGGLFLLTGEQKSAGGFAATRTGERDTDKRIVGIDVAGDLSSDLRWYGQVLWNSWAGFLDGAPAQDYDWLASFVGLDYVLNDRWAFSLLHNFAEADDFDDTGTIYEGLAINSVTGNASYYFMRNVKAVAELNLDLLSRDRDGPPYVGHQSEENYFLLGLDVAF